MDVQQYIESGILEEYCMGLLNAEEQSFLIRMTMLYPEVKEELTAVELALEKLALSAAVKPREGVKQNILASLGFDDTKKQLDINNLPAVDERSDYLAWLNTLSHLLPVEPADFFIHEVRKDDACQQMLVVTNMDVPEEEHGEFIESFFILDGKCECTVGDEFFMLNAGDFLEIPLHTKHDIKIVSPYVTAILQYRFI